jgi:hypothetical protein
VKVGSDGQSETIGAAASQRDKTRSQSEQSLVYADNDDLESIFLGSRLTITLHGIVTEKMRK